MSDQASSSSSSSSMPKLDSRVIRPLHERLRRPVHTNTETFRAYSRPSSPASGKSLSCADVRTGESRRDFVRIRSSSGALRAKVASSEAEKSVARSGVVELQPSTVTESIGIEAVSSFSSPSESIKENPSERKLSSNPSSVAVLSKIIGKMEYALGLLESAMSDLEDMERGRQSVPSRSFRTSSSSSSLDESDSTF